MIILECAVRSIISSVSKLGSIEEMRMRSINESFQSLVVVQTKTHFRPKSPKLTPVRITSLILDCEFLPLFKDMFHRIATAYTTCRSYGAIAAMIVATVLNF